MKSSNVLRFIESGILIAVATVLSLFQPFQLPFGGGITIVSMLPIVIVSYRYGVKWGIFTGFTYSLLMMATGYSTVRGLFLPDDDGGSINIIRAILIILLDYICAYTMLGIGGLFRNKLKAATGLCLGAIAALTARYIVHIISGAVFYGAWAEWFFTQEGFYKAGDVIMNNFSGKSLAVIYSVFYNGLYMIPEIILTAIAAYFIGKIPYITRKKQ